MEKVHHPLVSIITLNCNQTNITCQLLESLRFLTYKHFEVLVCDMGSTVDPTRQIESGNYPNTKVLRSERNLGFTGGNNLGMLHAKGDYVFILNNDTEVTPCLLEKLLEVFRKNLSVGIVCPKILSYSHPDIIQYAGFTPINFFTGRSKAIGYGEEDRGQYDQAGFTAFAHGVAMLVSREVIDNVGMFLEKFFMFYEEMDWSARINKAGYKIYFEPSARIYHKESISRSKQSALIVYYHTRNRILYMKRNTNLFQFISFLLYFTLVFTPGTIFKFVLSRQYEHLKFFLKGAVWNLSPSKYRTI